jgi:hypothetical protein
MANKITVSMGISFNKFGMVANRTMKFSAPIVGTKVAYGVTSIGTVEEELTMIASPGFVYLKNLDPTNFILVGAKTTEYHIQLMPNDFAFFKTSDSIFAKADTAACDMEYYIFEV